MDLQTIAMPRGEALQAFRDYRAAVRERFNKEDAALMRGYKALAKGRQVLDVHDAFRQAGVDARGRPRLAISRADLPRVFMVRWRSGAVCFSRRAEWWREAGTAFYRIKFPDGTLPATENRVEAVALVPIIPPRFRPVRALRGYHVLWEAEWQDVPRDPLLLKHLSGALYAVLAVWDLTPLERAVLRGRQT